MQDFQQILDEKLFQIYTVTEYGNILFAYSPNLPVLSEHALRILPISVTFTGLKKFCFHHITISDLYGSIVHNKQVVWAFFTKSDASHLHSKNLIFLLALFLKFLNTKPNTLQGILMTEKDKTDRQGYEFSVHDLTVENLNTYNECFLAYKELIDLSISKIFEEFLETYKNFDGFIMNTKGDIIVGKVPGPPELKEMVVNRGKHLKTEYRNEFTNMKIELSLINTKLVVLAGFCAALNGLIIGVSNYIDLDFEYNFRLLHNSSIYWDSDHGHLAKYPEPLYEKLSSFSSLLKKFLVHIVPTSVKGFRFSEKVSSNHSRIHLSEDFHDRQALQDLSLHYNDFDEEMNVEPTHKEQLENISMIEKFVIEEETELFLFSQDRVTPALVNLDEIVEEVQERRSKTPSRIYEMSSPQKIEKDENEMLRLSKNGRWFRKSTESLRIKALKPKLFRPVPPLSEPGFIRRIRKSRSSQELNKMNLLEFEDYKKIGIKDIYQHIEQYAVKNHRPSRDDWMD